MSSAPTILLVHADESVRARWANHLAVAGYVTTGIPSFDEAKAALATTPPALLITGVRLGPYHGLHLIARCRVDHPGTATLLVSDIHDAILEAEAIKLGTSYLVEPERGDVFSTKVAGLLAGTAL